MRRADELRERARRAAQRGEALRERHGSVDAVYVIVDRDLEVGGGLMSGALAYRIFIWLLPLALVFVGGIGLYAEAAEETPESAARSVGLTGIVSSSIAEASQGSSRWYAILIGIPLLFWATRSLLRALLVVHRLVWGDVRRVVQRPTLAATARALAMLAGFFVIRDLSRRVELWTGSLILAVLVGVCAVLVWWLVMSLQLPHGDATWRYLVPGAALVAVGLELIGLVGSFVIAPRVERSETAYGALGVAATLLFGLYLVSRLIVASAVVNSTFWARRTARALEEQDAVDRVR